jgi:hypothetical protein
MEPLEELIAKEAIGDPIARPMSGAALDLIAPTMRKHADG